MNRYDAMRIKGRDAMQNFQLKVAYIIKPMDALTRNKITFEIKSWSLSIVGMQRRALSRTDPDTHSFEPHDDVHSV